MACAEVTLIIVNELGLHARCAAMIAKVAAGAKGPVRICASGQTADATDILDMLMIAPFASRGKEITISTEHGEDKDVLEQLTALVRDGFGED